jgi:transcriptional regulator GlxA family with amidase domain
VLVAAHRARPRASSNVEPDLICVRDSRLITSADNTAGIDLALALVGQQHGPRVAVAVAKRLVVAQRQGQSRFSPFLTAAADPASPIARIQAGVTANLGRRHALQSLATEVG